MPDSPTSGSRHLHTAHPADQVARWEQLAARYPEASFSARGGWFYGSLRAADQIFRASSLKRLIDGLLSRESGAPEITA